MHRYLLESQETRGSDLVALDVGFLRTAKQQLHQAWGALEMVNMPAAATMLLGMEQVLQRYVKKPDECTEQSVQVLERASFALMEYLDTALSGRATPAAALFPQYREIQALAGNDKAHPADLWSAQTPWAMPALATPTQALAYGPQTRAQLEQAVLSVVKSAEAQSAAQLRDISLGLAQSAVPSEQVLFWKVAAGFFDALAHRLLAPDLYVKRVASRVLMQYALYAKGDVAEPTRLLHDMLFFCAQTGSGQPLPSALKAVYDAMGLHSHTPVEYAQIRFGRFDPALLVQARKRIASAAESWSALVGGDKNKLKAVVDQFSLVCDSLQRLQPGSAELVQGITRVMQGLVQRGQPPEAGVAMEVATAVLYLQAAFATLEQGETEIATHAKALAERLQHVLSGEQPLPLEPWMEELYRQASDAQTMGSVVGELRGTLAETEKVLDQFFRQPTALGVLSPVVGYLSQMRGVLSVLGLDQAALAMSRMREAVEQLVHGGATPAEQAKLFERLGNSLGALGFLIDMLSYQRAMARKLFVYDEAHGELRPVMGRAPAVVPTVASALAPMPQAVESTLAPAVVAEVKRTDIGWSEAPASIVGAPQAQTVLDALQHAQPPLETPPVVEKLPEVDMAAQRSALDLPLLMERAPETAPIEAIPAVSLAAPPAQAEVDADDELLQIFLDEAREVIATGRAALQALSSQPENLSEQTILRRAFHTLKGSSRMVGLTEFGDAAWSLEQMLNTWLAEQQPMPAAMQVVSLQAMSAFTDWTQAIENQTAQLWQSTPICASADAMREQGQYVAIDERALRGEAAAPMPADSIHEALPSIADAPFADATAAMERLPLDNHSTALDGGVPHAAPLQDGLPLYESIGAAHTDQPAVLDLAREIDFSEFESALLSVPTVFPEDGIQPPIDAALPAIEQGNAFEVAQTSQEVAPDMVAEPAVQGGPRQIGDLRIPQPLFDVFLGEAEEGSQELLAALQAWQSGQRSALPAEAPGLAHNLAGSSAAVGFYDLSALARAMESALLHVQLQEMGEPFAFFAESAQPLVAGAKEIRRLLHQFAAGFLKVPQPDVLQSLADLLAQDGRPAEEAGVEPLVPIPAEAAMAPASTPVPTPALPSAEDAPLELQAADVPVVHAQVPEPEADDDIDVFDVIDPDLFPIFEEEAVELLPAMGASLRQWAMAPSDVVARNTVLRALHTLKGSARLAGAMRLGEMAHRLESLLEPLDPEQATTADIEPLLLRVDGLQASFDHLRSVGARAGNEPMVVHGAAQSADAAALEDASADPLAMLSRNLLEGVGVQTPNHAVRQAPARPQAAGIRSSSQQTVRVRSQLLDKLINEAGEVMIARSRLDARMGVVKSALSDLGGNLERLRQQLRDLEVQAESQMQSRMAYSKEAGADFDPLEFDRFTRVQELTRMMAESVNDVATVQRHLQREVVGAEDDLVAQGRQARDLQRNLLRTRMVEFDSVAERLYAVVRGSAKETGKQVKLDIEGGTIEMDRGVLERMAPAFEHLLRNCVGHGIESPEARVAAGKSAQGSITVQVQQEGNDVAVAIRDDGAGLNVARIREKAVALGLVSADEAVNGERAAELIFMPGFTTAATLTELSGRGIGMDVVRTEVQALGGRIETETQEGQGSMFRMVLPLTTAVTQVSMLRMGSFTVGIPANLVENVRRLTAEELDEAYRSGSVRDGAVSLPFYWGGAVWQQSGRSTENEPGRTQPVLIVRSAAQRIAVHVDELLGNQEVVIKHLGPQMVRLPGLTGMSVLPSGAVVLIYNPVALTAVYGERIRTLGLDGSSAQGGMPPADGTPGAGGGAQVPLVMVVDDSITVRRVTQRLLQREGYRVVMAADGQQALDKLAGELPCVVLSDIEMPQMDGFDLVRHIRADARLQHLPLVMITSRTADKHREHAMALGANHYLGKPYRDEELMGLVQHYAGQLQPTESPALAVDE